MITVELDPAQLAKLNKAVAVAGSRGGKSKYRQEIAIAINKTTKRGRRAVAKKVTERLNTAQKNVISKMPKPPRATAAKMHSVIVLKKSRRIPLHELSRTRQNKTGIAYRVDKGRGPSVLPSGFMGPRPGRKAAGLRGLAALRVGKKRKPLRFPKGVSPWGMFVKNKMEKRITDPLEEILRKEIERRTRAVLAKVGLLPR